MKDVHQLKIFLAVAEQLSFTRAAETLYLTQSAVSHQVARLEAQLGTSLLSRQGRTVTLTPAGRELVPHIRRVLSALEDATVAVRLASRPDAGHLRVGATSTACQHLIPEALREFRECFPAYTLSILPADSPALAESLLEGAIDLAVMVRPDRRAAHRQPLVFHDLFSDELGMLVSPQHPWAKAGKVDRRQLGDQQWVLYSRASATFRLVERYLARNDAPLRQWIELGSMEAIKELVKLGLGISVLAPWIAQAELAEGSLSWFRPPSTHLRRTWSVATLAVRELSSAERTFIGLCQAAAKQMTPDTKAERRP